MRTYKTFSLKREAARAFREALHCYYETKEKARSVERIATESVDVTEVLTEPVTTPHRQLSLFDKGE